MAHEPSWAQLADKLADIKSVERLRAQWHAYVGSENYGIWIVRPDRDAAEQVRASFTLTAAQIIEKLGIPPVPLPQPLQHCPHWDEYCGAEEDMARRAGEVRDLTDAVPYGLSTIDRDAVDPCTRAFLEVLRHESRAFRIRSGTDWVKGRTYATVDGSIDDLCGAAAAYCKRRARDEIGARLGSRLENADTSRASVEPNLAQGTDAESSAIGREPAGTGNAGPSDTDPLNGWRPANRVDWAEEVASADECPAFLRPIKAVRLAAIATLRTNAADIVQRTKPQSRQDVEQCLWPILSEYAEELFDKMAQTKLNTGNRSSRPGTYGRWLRSKCLTGILDDICRPINGQFVISVRHVAEIVGDVHGPADVVATRSVLWRTYAEEVVPQSSTRSLETRLANILRGERIPYWESRVAQPPPPPSVPAHGSATMDSISATLQGAQPPVPRTPRRIPDLESSRERINLVSALARELAAIKQDLSGYCSAEDLMQKHPEFILWEHIRDAELKELADGSPFTPKAYAENLTLRRYGITSRETLKKDRRKLRKAQRIHPNPPSS